MRLVLIFLLQSSVCAASVTSQMTSVLGGLRRARSTHALDSALSRARFVRSLEILCEEQTKTTQFPEACLKLTKFQLAGMSRAHLEKTCRSELFPARTLKVSTHSGLSQACLKKIRIH
ncbi:MAG: hypothetical protein K2X47_05015, partial [Bdellovibrionales bacterium]|nr:hypothetical protein [Bdellovibrionales bacterium]